MVLTTPESIIEQASTVNLLDDLIDESVRTSARRPIMMQFDPSSGWIWRRWTGTIFAETWTSCVRNMAYALCIYVLHRTYPAVHQNHLAGFGTLWGQLLSVTTFTLTFFVNQSYSLWRKCMELSRRLQGRLHDINMNLASHAARKMPSNPNEKSTYTASSRQILELMSRYVRLFNLLTYASFTRSHRPILTPRGMRRLVERGLMTATEREVLVDAAIPATQRHSVVLMWMIRLFVEGRESGHIQGGAGFEAETMNKFHIIRSQYGAIGDELQGRMPLAYAHIVQVLVDLILWMFPVMAFSISMSPFLVVLGTGLLTISYQGLFDLAKQFLDPYDNENYGRGEDPLCVDTLIAETNAGSVRWLYGFEELPFSAQRVADGEMYDYLLPVRGYSVEELAQMEEERIEREKQLEEQRKREEEEAAERLRKEAEEMAEKEHESEEANLVDSEMQIQSMEELIEELAAEPMDAVEITGNRTKTKEKSQRKSKRVSVKGDRTDAIDSVDLNVNVTAPANKTDSVSEIKQKSNATSTKTASAKESGRQLHKVTTLATGSPVTFNPIETAKKVVEQPVPSNIQATNYLATLRQEVPRPPEKPSVSFVPDLVEYQQFEDLPWHDEKGPDGKEIRLSQQLADETWAEEEDDVETKTMTWDEYQQRLQEIKENTENEYRETSEILSASPGADGDEKMYTVKERRKKAPPTYDQTRLDGISQLWGLPPEDPSNIGEYEPPEKIEDLSFDSISQLWGGASLSDKDASSKKSKKKDDPDDVVGINTFAGISELWGNGLDDFQDDFNQDGADSSRRRNATRSMSEGVDDDDLKNAQIFFSDIPWHNERGKDGKEIRLSEMLANEEWETEDVPEETTAMTLEDYNKQVEEILTQAEEELRETEAILMSKPGTDPLGWDYNDEDLAPMSEKDEVEQEENVVQAENDSEDLTVLEMDSQDEVEVKATDDKIPDELTMEEATINANGDIAERITGGVSDLEESEDGSNSRIESDGKDTEDGTTEESKPGTDNVEEWNLSDADGNATESVAEDTSNTKSEGALDIANVDGINAEHNTEKPTSKEAEDRDAKGSDMIQPIFLEGESENASGDHVEGE
jgi:hypothetical protein